MEIKNPAVVLGMFETGLGVGRCLGRNKIKVFGLDFKKDVGFYSKYIKAYICPHPSIEEKKFLDFLINFSKRFEYKPVLYITSDSFLDIISRNRNSLEKYYFMNISSQKLLESIRHKFDQYHLALNSGVYAPETYFPKDLEEVNQIKDKLDYPVIIKAEEVTKWRKEISDTIKGFWINNPNELVEKFSFIFKKNVQVVIQKIILGPAPNHFLYCAYVSQNGEFLHQFIERKFRNFPYPFGIGSAIKSFDFPELLTIGEKFFKNINYRGTGMAEFKLDEEDDKLKLIEVNPRYWQQIALPERCGMNFALTEYLDITKQNPKPIDHFELEIKWVNIYLDFNSFLIYRRNGLLDFKEWLNTLKGKKVFSIFTWDDMLPVCYDLCNKSITTPKNLLKRIYKSDNQLIAK